VLEKGSNQVPSYFVGSPRRENLAYKNQGWEPIHQKYKANESMSRHNPKKKTESKQSMKNKEKKTLCK
jgi:hypothetical protein